MRYISIGDNKVLYTNGGISKYRFKYGVLNATLDIAEYADSSLEMQAPFPVLTGANAGKTIAELAWDDATDAEKKEMMGQGDLAVAANRLDRERFYEAPIITPTTSTVAAVAGTTYIVTKGTVTYDGTAYTAGQTFVADGSAVDTTTSNGGRFALYFPAALLDEPAQYTEEAFKIAHLGTETDALSYWSYTAPGFTPQPQGYVKS